MYQPSDMNTAPRLLLSGCIAACLCAAARAEDWPQYRGPAHNGISSEHIFTAWPAAGPRRVWKVPLTDGFSTITTGGGRAYTLVGRQVDGAQQEVCVALDANTGRELWFAPLGIANYDSGGERGLPGNDGGDGPRSTPAYDDNRVYTYSSQMALSCFDAATGRRVWSHDIVREFSGRNISWQCGASPLVDGNLVFVAGGGSLESLLAFDKSDGHVVWKELDERLTHSTPVAATISGVRQIIFFTQSGLVSVAPATGELLWRYPFRRAGAIAMSPVVFGNIVYCSVAYGVGSSACVVTLTGDHFTATRLWFQPAGVINNQWMTPVCANGYLYGLFGQHEFGSGPMKCVELSTGRVMWSQEGFGPGGCILADGHILVLSDSGDLVLVKTNPSAYTEVARTHALDGKCWNCPSISNGRIYARSTKEGVCLDVSPNPTPGP
jgi:outer membrane protein assembly factor BamB